MAISYNNLAAQDLASVFNTDYPAGSFLIIYTGAPPGPNNGASGTLLSQITLPASPWNAASGKSITKNGTWSVAAGASGTAGYYRLVNAAGTKLEEGTVTATGGGGDATIDSTTIASGQTITCTGFTRTFP